VTDHKQAWARWNEIHRLRTQNPYDVAKQFLREAGYIVETPETLSLPVAVARFGSFTATDGYRVELQARVRIGDRIAACGHAIDARQADMLARAFSGAIADKFRKMIMAELEPQIEQGCQRELNEAREGME